MSVKKIPIESTWAEFWKVWFMPPPAPRSLGGRLFITAARFGRGEHAHRDAVQEQDHREQRIGEVDRQQRSTTKLSAAPSIPPVANQRAPKRSER